METLSLYVKYERSSLKKQLSITQIHILWSKDIYIKYKYIHIY